MKEKYLIDKDYFIHEYEKFYDHPWVTLKELSMHTFFVGKCGKYEIHCNYNKEWFLYDEDNKDWVNIIPIMIPDEIYNKSDKDMFHFNHLYPLNGVETILKNEDATDEFIIDLCELTDMLNNYMHKDNRKNY